MMKKMHYSIMAGICLLAACSKSATPVVDSPPVEEAASFTSADATAAFNRFNTAFYSTADKLYYATTEKNSIGAIWTQAIFWDIAMDAYQRTKDENTLQLVNDIYAGGYNRYDKYNWENTTTWFIYDDMMWWIMALSRAYEITGTQSYLDTAVSGFDRVWRDSYDPENGGMWWNFTKTGKNACINFPTVIAAAKLYNITGETSYLEKATMIYEWGVTNLFNSANGRVADFYNNGSQNWTDYTYNQGTFIGASVFLYKITGDAGYLNKAILAANYTQKTMCGTSGLLPAEGDWNEQGVLKAILARYLMMLVEDGGQSQYLDWIRTNINTAWENRDASRGITYRDYGVPCPSGTVQSYEASSAVGFMQVCPPAE